MNRSGLVVAGYYGFENAGDELILSALLAHERSLDPGMKAVVLSHDPARTRRRYGVAAVSRWRPWLWFPVFFRSKRFILGGGGLFQETTGPWNYAYYLGLLVLAKLCGCRTELRAVGVDPIGRPWNRHLIRLVLSHSADWISVRDRASETALRAAGLRRPVAREADWVYRLRAAAPSGRRSPRVAFAVSPRPERSQWTDEFAALLVRLHRHVGLEADFLVFFPKEDAPVLAGIQTRLPYTPMVRHWSDPTDLVEWIGDYELVVSMRYHALVLAARRGTAFVGWGDQTKVRAVCEEFNQPHASFNRGWDEDDAFRLISEAWCRRAALSVGHHNGGNLIYSQRTV